LDAATVDQPFRGRLADDGRVHVGGELDPGQWIGRVGFFGDSIFLITGQVSTGQVSTGAGIAGICVEFHADSGSFVNLGPFHPRNLRVRKHFRRFVDILRRKADFSRNPRKVPSPSTFARYPSSRSDHPTVGQLGVRAHLQQFDEDAETDGCPPRCGHSQERSVTGPPRKAVD